MTTFHESAVRCTICKAENTITILTSNNEFGSPDLDNRPAEMRRSTMPYWVQACDQCGYVAYDLKKAISAAEKEAVQSPAYQELRTNPAYPDLATRFLRLSFLAEGREDWASAGQGTLHAAWDCDDAGEQYAESARQYRLRANELILRADHAGTPKESQAGYWNLLRTDLLRRANDMVAAAELCRQAVQSNPDPMIAQLLRFEKTRIDAEDANCYDVAEAFDAIE